MTQERLSEALSAAGADPAAAVLVGPPDPSSPPPPEGPWVVVPFDGSFVVGGFSRGAFRDYATVGSFDDAEELALRLVTAPAAHRPAGADLEQRGAETAVGVRARTAAAGGVAHPADLAPGDVLDLLGPETAHHLYALGTPYPERAQPPSDVGAPYHRYEVLRPLPDAQEGLAAAWFEQPGGGAMVVLARPVRWYVDQGLLVELVDGPEG